MPQRTFQAISLIALVLGLLGCQAKTPANRSQPGLHSVTLTWKASASKDVDGYRVYRSNDPNAAPGLLAVTPADATRYIDTSVEAGRTYYYSVRAFDTVGRESAAAQISATIPNN